MTIEELFGTLQQSVVSAWRKHLRTAKYSKHMALNDFYEEMPEKVDALIEAWMGVNGRKIKSYDNILQSKNMNTLLYLKELRKVVKQGYALMNDEAELEAKLDDIVELIDSTLYKVKELNENKTMKNLKDYVSESLNINEAVGKTYFYFDHDDPSILLVVANAPAKFEKEYDYVFPVDTNSPIVSVQWNDESLYHDAIPGSNFAAAKNSDLKNIEDQLKQQEGEEYPYIESLLAGFGQDDFDEVKPKPETAKDYLNWFIKAIKNSEVDSDSSYGRAVLDMKKQEVCLAGEVEVNFVDYKDLFDEE